MGTECEASCHGTRRALLEAALLSFGEAGYDGTSIRDVAGRAGRHVSLIAHHFGNKEGLYRAVMLDILEHHCPAWWAEPHVDEATLASDPDRARDLLRRIIVHQFRALSAAFGKGDEAMRARFRLWMASLPQMDPELVPVVRERVAPLRLQVASCIRALRPDVPEEELPFWFSLVHGQCVVNTMLHRYNALVFGESAYPADLDAMAAKAADVTLKALEA